MEKNRAYWSAKCRGCLKTGTTLAKEENLELRDFIINDAIFAEQFFYEYLKPMISGFAYKISKSYGVKVPEAEIASIIYLECYSRSWSRLIAYQGECSLYSWVAAVSAPGVFEGVEELGYIIRKSVEQAKQYTLTLKSIRDRNELEMILDLVDSQEMYDVLAYTYLHRLSEEEVMTMMNLKSEEEYRKLLKTAQQTLLEMLIAKGEYLMRREDGTMVNLCTLAMSKVGEKVDESAEINDIIGGVADGEDDDPYGITDILSLRYPGMNWREKFSMLIGDTIEELGWSEEQKAIFYARFYDGEASKSLAMRLGIKNCDVDRKFSRLRKALRVELGKCLIS